MTTSTATTTMTTSRATKTTKSAVRNFCHDANRCNKHLEEMDISTKDISKIGIISRNNKTCILPAKTYTSALKNS
jgi:hypothetical protein